MPIPLIHYLYPSGLPKFLRKHAGGENSWALVTGATDGIGFALCTELSERGFNVVLHSRNESKLKRVREELQAAHPDRHFRTVAVDASSFTAADIDRIVAQVADIPLTVLINNVGGTHPLSTNFMRFEDHTASETNALISLNFQFPIQLTLALIPRFQMQKDPTLIVTCTSQSYIGQAYAAPYSACKGGLHAFMRGLSCEQSEARNQVEVLEAIVGSTYTQQLEKDPNFSAGLFFPTPDKVAHAILARVGHGYRSIVPYFWHSVMSTIIWGLLPASVADVLIARILEKSIPKKEK